MYSRAPEESLARFASSNDYLDTFYRIFLGSNKAMAAHFEKVDLDSQKMKLSVSLPQFLALPLLAPDAPERSEAIEKHRKAHLGRGSKESYQLWVDTVCKTFRQHDPKYTDAIDRELRERLTQAVELVRGSN